MIIDGYSQQTMNRIYLLPIAVFAVISLLISPPAAAQKIEDKQDVGKTAGDDSFWFPYIFQTETSEIGVGGGYSAGAFSDGGSLFAGAFVTANESWGLNFSMNNYRLGSSRWYFDFGAMYADNTDQRFYGDLATFLDEVEGGTHNSSPDDFLNGEGISVNVDLDLRYVLPIGNGKSNVVANYQTDSGILIGPPSGGSSWNPMKGGRTVAAVKAFYQKRTLGITDENSDQFPPVLGLTPGDTAESNSNGLALSIEYDNRDFSTNASSGSFQKITATKDFGWADSTNEWHSFDFEYSKFLDLGTSEKFMQKVLALNFWTATAPTFRRETIADTIVVRNAPPSYMGAHLGGPKRMRSYPIGRFSDGAAIYYSAELRLIPSWNPVKDWPLIRNTSMRWWQWVAFVEAGRVAPDWDFSELMDDMNVDFGFGVRTMIGSQVIRFDLAIGEESTQLWFQMGQPF